MINSLSLRAVSSYSPTVAVKLGPLKELNLIYGQNGTGKTTISNFLQALGDPMYHACALEETSGAPDILVYNQNFVEKNFHSGTQPGVFTLNEGNIEAEKALEAAEAAIKVLETREAVEFVAGQKIKAAEDALRDKLREDVWSPRQPFEDSPLKYCLKGPHTKDRLLDKMKLMAYAPTTDTFAALAAEAQELQEASDEEISQLPRLSFSAQSVEGAPLFREQILASDQSYLSALILALGNSDWIKSSFKYLDSTTEKCPLCQQGLPVDFYDQLTQVFDTTYQARVQELDSLASLYSSALALLISQTDGVKLPTPELIQGISELRELLMENMRRIEEKLRAPSSVIELERSAEKLEAINALIDIERERIDAINRKVKEKGKYLGEINTRFWNCYRGGCDKALKETAKKVATLAQERADKCAVVVEIHKEIEHHKLVIADAKNQITNIDKAVENINGWLNVLGLQGFELKPVEGEVPQYRLQRQDVQAEVFRTLSEGEKTLISFLYFLEMCNGELDAESTKLKHDRIIVIDDPISSLSHNYVYDVASLIRRQVLHPAGRFKQVILLTHNLFFFHEMIKLTGEEKRHDEKRALFKVTKAAYTAITPLDRADVRNDYQAFWHAIKDALAGKTSATIVPNMMRNILEYYFSFVHRKEKLSHVLNDLADEHPEFRSFYRYINRESHSDAVNLTGFGNIEVTQYVAQFRKVFVATEFEDHYEQMMN